MGKHARRSAVIVRSIRTVVDELERRVLLSDATTLGWLKQRATDASLFAPASAARPGQIAAASRPSLPGQVAPPATMITISGPVTAPVRVPIGPINSVPHPASPSVEGEPSQDVVAVSWTGSGDGTNWTDPLNWSTGALPDTNSDVTVPAGYSLTLGSGTQSVHSLTLNSSLTVSGGSLQTAAGLFAGSSLSLAGGTLGGAVRIETTGFFTLSGGTLDGVTFNGTALMLGGAVTVTNGLTLANNAAIAIANGSALQFAGTQTLGGLGTIGFSGVSGPPNTLAVQGDATTTLTIAPNVTIGASSNGLIAFSGSETIINQGTIRLDTAGRTLQVAAGSGKFRNAGLIHVQRGTFRLLGGELVNSGVVAVDPGATFVSNAAYTQAAAGTVNVTLNGTGTTQYSRLQLLGPTQLAGTLAVATGNGFTPSAGNTFNVLTFNNPTGQFANYTGLTFANGVELQPTYTATTLSLAAGSATNAPDLRVTTVAASPAQPQSGGELTVSWTVANAGNGATTGSWADRVTVVNTTTGQTIANVLVPYDAGTSGPIAAGGTSAVRSRAIELPDGAAGAGRLEITVTADANNAVAEYYPGGVGESNNSAGTSVISTLAPTPDLQVSGLAVVTPTPMSGRDLTVQWTDANTGEGPANRDWADQVRIQNLTTGQVLAVSDVSYSVSASGVVPAGGATPTRSYTFRLPDGPAGVGTLRVTVIANANGGVTESSSANNAATVDATSTLAPYPDLRADSIVIPAKAFTSQKVLVSWTDRNTGQAAASGTWSDYVYVADNAAGVGKTLVGGFEVTASLAVGETLDRTQEITLPGTAGDYYVFVTANASTGVFETDVSNNTGVSAGTIAVTATPLPNLFVTAITPPSSTVFSGQTVPITFVVQNQGAAPTSVPRWFDWVGLSQDPTIAQTFDPRDDRPFTQLPFVTSVPNASYLAPGQSYTQTVNVTLPQTAQGTWYVYASPDGTGNRHPQSMPEISATGKLAVSAGFNVQLTPPPDLTITRVQTGQQLFSGQTTSVSWTTKNVGPGVTAATNWSDTLYLSASPTFDNTAQPMATMPHNGVVAAGGSYSASANVTLPTGISGPYYFFVKTDVGARVFENGATSNNVGRTSAASTVNLTPPPDFVVQTVSVPVNGVAGQNLTVAYTVRNAGAGTTDRTSWDDAFYLSPTPTFNAATARDIGGNRHNGALAAGESYSDTHTFTLPADAVGTWYVIVRADRSAGVFELDRANNLGASATPVNVVQAPADLVVGGVTVPSTATPGSGVTVTWSVQNQSTGPTAGILWEDRVYLTATGIVDANAVLLATATRSGALAGGAAYAQSRVVPLPVDRLGPFKIVVVTDAAGQLSESSDTNNTSSPASLTIAYPTEPGGGGGGGGGGGNPTTPRLPDLLPAIVTAPATATAGSAVTVAWTVQNAGDAAADAAYWYDDVWLSTDASPGNADDVHLGSLRRVGPLAASGTYAASLSVTLPRDLPSGDYRLFVTTDRPAAVPAGDGGVNTVYEGNETNNTAVASVTAVGAIVKPDLVVSGVTAPTSATAGAKLTVGWTVQNTGGAASATFYDGVYLSYDNVLDSADKLLGYVGRNGIGVNETYAGTGTFDLPAGTAGTFRVIVAIDLNKTIAESDETNNTRRAADPVVVALPAPADLVAGTIALPATALAGQPLSLSYQVTNTGQNTATGSWTDTLYLSTTPEWTTRSVLLGRVNQDRTLSPGASYTGTLNSTVPGLRPGNYYVVLRTNILNTFPEQTLANNLSASLTQTLLDAPALTLGTPVSGMLAERGFVYYKLTAPARRTLRFDLTGLLGASNEMYVSYGTLPTRTQYDQRHDDPLGANQSITVANSRAGDYYVLVYADNLPNGSSSETYTLTATARDFSVDAISPRQVDNSGSSTLRISGARFDRDTRFTLTGPTGQSTTAYAVRVADAGTAYATFALANKPAGTYTLSARRGDGSVAQLTTDTLHVVRASTPTPVVHNTGAANGWIETYFQPPLVARPNRIASVTLTWVNRSTHDLAAPLLQVSSPSSTAMGLRPDELASDGYLWFMGTSPDGPPGVLRPGQSVSRTIYYRGGATAGTNNSFRVSVFKGNDPVALDLKPYLPQTLIDRPDFAAVYAKLRASIGDTWGAYVQTLAINANLLPPEIGDNASPTRLLDLSIENAIAEVTTSIRGHVDAADPSVDISGRLVHATNGNTGDVFAAYTRVDGTFVLNDLTAGPYTLSFDGGVLAGPAELTLAAGEHKTNVALAVAAGGQLTGAVGTAAGRAVDGAVLRLVGTAGSAFSAASAADGAYAFDGLPADTYELTATADGLARTIVGGIVIVDADSAVSRTVLMAGGGSVSARVGTPGSEAAAVTLTAYPAGQTAAAFTVSGTSSDLLLEGLPAGSYDLTLAADGFVTQTFAGRVVAAGQTLALGDVTLIAGATITGRIVATAGAPAPGGQAVTVRANGVAVRGVLADSEGNFRITGLPAGTYTLGLSDSGLFGPDVTVAVATGESASTDLSLLPGGGITGVVTDRASGVAYGGVRVIATDATGVRQSRVTDSVGRYAFTGLAAGDWRVTLAEGASSDVSIATISALDGTSVTIDLALTAAAKVTGRMTDASGQAVANATISVRQSGQIVASARADGDGRYTLLLVRAGVYDLLPSSADAGFAPVLGYAVTAGTSPTVNFVAGAATIAASTAATEGTATLVRIDPGGEWIVAGKELTADGHASFANLVDGNYRVDVTASDGRRGSSSLALAAGQTQTASVTLAAAFAVSGVVRGPGGAPVAGALIVAHQSDDPTRRYTAVTDADGAYVLPLPAGTYDLVTLAAGLAPSVQAGVALNAATSRDVSLVASTATLEGRVIDDAGRPVAFGSVAVRDPAGRLVGLADADASGAYVVDVPPGSGLTVSAAAAGYLASADVVINATAGMTPVTPLALTAVGAGVETVGPAVRNRTPRPTPRVVVTPALGVPDWISGLVTSFDREPKHLTKGNVSPVGECVELTYMRDAVLRAVAIEEKYFDQAKTYHEALRDLALGLGLDVVVDVVRTTGYVASLMSGLGSVFTKLKPLYTIAEKVPAALKAIHQIDSTIDLGDTVLDKIKFYKSAATPGGAKITAGSIVSDMALMAELMGEVASGLADFARSDEFREIFKGMGNWLSLYSTVLDIKEDAEKALNAARDLYDNSVALAGIGNDFQFAQRKYKDAVFAAYTLNVNYEQALAACRRDGHAPAPPTDPLPSPLPPPNPNPYPGDDAGPGGTTGSPIGGADDFDDPNDPYDPGTGFGGAGIDVPTGAFMDPNDIIGPAGVGDEKFVSASERLGYTIRFENIPDATLPAPTVVVTQTLDADLDARSFRLGTFGFGNAVFAVPDNVAFYQTRIDRSDAGGYFVDVTGTIDVRTRMAIWTFTTVDPATGEVPIDPSLGFLPPDDETGRGEGFVSYTVAASPAAQTGARVDAQASIVFGDNPPLETPSIFNTLDRGDGLATAVTPLPEIIGTKDFVVTWSGATGAAASAVKGYTIYVSDDDGPFVPWLANTPLTSATFPGQFDHTYRFYSVGQDNAGNIEAVPLTPDAATTVRALVTVTLALPSTPPTYTGLPLPAGWATATVTGPDGAPAPTGVAQVVYHAGPTADGPALASPPVDAGTYTAVATYAGDDVYGPASSAPATFTIARAAVTVTLPAAPSPLIEDGTSGVTAWVQAVVRGTGDQPAGPTGPVTYVYYAGTTATGTPLAAAPTTAGTYTVVALYGGNTNYLPGESAPVTFTVAPPTALSAAFRVDDGTAQRSMIRSVSVLFTSPVTVQPGGITLTDANGAAVPFAIQTTDRQTYRLAFTGPSLADGKYRLNVRADAVTADDSSRLAADVSHAFWRLFGDYYGTGVVNNADKALFAQAYKSKAAALVPYFDSDGNGILDAVDLAAFNANFGKSIG